MFRTIVFWVNPTFQESDLSFVFPGFICIRWNRSLKSKHNFSVIIQPRPSGGSINTILIVWKSDGKKKIACAYKKRSSKFNYSPRERWHTRFVGVHTSLRKISVSSSQKNHKFIDKKVLWLQKPKIFLKHIIQFSDINHASSGTMIQ